MRWEYIGTGLGLVAIGVTLMVALPPPWAPKMSPHLVQVGILGGLVLTLVGIGMAFVGVWPGIPERTVGPVFFLILGGLFILAGGTWLYLRSGQGTEEIASNIAVGCRSELLPKTFGPNEGVRVLNLFPTPVENGGGGLAYFSNTSGKEWQWKTNDGPFAGEATRCEITNYGNAPVFDFKMFLDLTFIEAVDVPEQKNAKKQGAIKLQRKWIIDAQKIDVGPTNSFVFWIYNQSPDLFVHVLLPHTATMTKLGENKQIEANLKVPQIGSEIPLFFGPRFNFDALPNNQK